MSQYGVPNWINLRHQRQEQVEGEGGNRSSHVHNEQSHHSTAPLVHMYAVPSFFEINFFPCVYFLSFCF